MPLTAGVCAIAYFYPHPLVLFMPAFIFGVSIHCVRSRMFLSTLAAIAAYVVLVTVDLVLHRGLPARAVSFVSAWIIVGAVVHQSPKFLTSRPAQFLGDISYSFYLSHTAGLVVARILFSRLGGVPENEFFTFIFFVIASLGVTLPLAWCVHVLVEKPGMASGSAIASTLGRWLQDKFDSKRSTPLVATGQS